MNKMRVQIIFYFLIFLSFPSQAEFKLGYVDMQKAIQTTKDGKKAKKLLEKIFNKKKKSLAKREKDLKKMGEDIRKKKVALSESAYYKKIQNFEQERVKYQQILQKSQFEIQKKERELTLPILKKLKRIIADVAKKEGLSIVLEKTEQGILWGKSDLNLTDKIVKRFNKR